MSEVKLQNIYYSPRGYWKGLAAIKKLASAAKTSEDDAKDWLKKQALWQIYLPAPRHIPRPKFDITEPNEAHQADLLFLPHDRVKGKTYKYALTLVDVASRYKAAEPLTSKSSAEVSEALMRIYKRGPLVFPKLLMVDPGREFFGEVSQLMVKHNVHVRRGQAGNHRQQGIVERWNRTLAERLFGHQYAQELLLAARGSSERSVAWVRTLPQVIAALNNERTQLTGKKPVDAIKEFRVTQNPSRPAYRTSGLEEPILSPDITVRYLYASSPAEHELEKGRHRATDPVWSLTEHTIRNVVRQPGQPALYYLDETAPQRSFVREELMAIPASTELPPDRILPLKRR